MPPSTDYCRGWQIQVLPETRPFPQSKQASKQINTQEQNASYQTMQFRTENSHHENINTSHFSDFWNINGFNSLYNYEYKNLYHPLHSFIKIINYVSICNLICYMDINV